MRLVRLREMEEIHSEFPEPVAEGLMAHSCLKELKKFLFCVKFSRESSDSVWKEHNTCLRGRQTYTCVASDIHK
jgi:hypothetical protein